MTAAPTMKTAASETPSDETPSIGTGWASTNVAARRRASRPTMTDNDGDESPKDQAAAPARASPEIETGASRGKSRAVSFDTRPPGSFLPAALSIARTGARFTVLPVAYQAQPSPSARNEARKAAITATYASFAFQWSIFPSLSPSVGRLTTS